MIYGQLNHILDNISDEKLRSCIMYAKDNDLASYTLGRHDINEDVFVNIVSYETKEEDACFYEAHREYVDVHIMLDGKEIINVNEIDHMKQAPYEKENDFLPLFGDKKTAVKMYHGDVLICFPHDAHETAVKVDEKEKIKKAIFKVKL